MAGPSASVLLREPIDHAVELRIRSEIIRIAERVSYNDFWLDGDHHVQAMGPGERDDWLGSRPFILSLDEEYPGELDELIEDGLTDLFGWIPGGMLSFAAMSNQKIDHMLLAELCLSFAQMFDGIIDCNGQLLAEPDLGGDRPRDPVCVRNPVGITGTVWAHAYLAGSGCFCTSHFVDVEFMRSWRSHPAFHMIK